MEGLGTFALVCFKDGLTCSLVTGGPTSSRPWAREAGWMHLHLCRCPQLLNSELGSRRWGSLVVSREPLDGPHFLGAWLREESSSLAVFPVKWQPSSFPHSSSSYSAPSWAHPLGRVLSSLACSSSVKEVCVCVHVCARVSPVSALPGSTLYGTSSFYLGSKCYANERTHTILFRSAKHLTTPWQSRSSRPTKIETELRLSTRS